MTIGITKYNLLCNLGNDIDTAFQKALQGIDSYFCHSTEIIKGKTLRLGLIDCELNYNITNSNFDLRCNKLLLECLKRMEIEKLVEELGGENIAVVVATTNSGTMEYSEYRNPAHSELSNPALFLKSYYGLNNYSATVSTACSSGIKAFSIARDILNSDYAKAVIVAGVDSLSNIPLFGFDSLEILSPTASNPFSKNRCGINISEGVAAFVLEKDCGSIEIAGIGETTDSYHPTTPNPDGEEAIKAINTALNGGKLSANDIDYINLHGTGTVANDLMEANTIYKIFGENTIASSTKPLTGHCLGAAASIETALCCKLLDSGCKTIFPHKFDSCYDNDLPKIRLARQGETVEKLQNILCTSFGFGGADAAIVLRRVQNNGKI